MSWLKTLWIFFAVYFWTGCSPTQEQDRLGKLLSNGDSDFQKVLHQKENYEVQILYSPVARIGDSISIVDHFYHFRPDDYFYPASSVKLPVAILAMQKLREIQMAGAQIDRHTAMSSQSSKNNDKDSIPSSTIPVSSTIGSDIDMIFAVSDNKAYNRLYEFTSQDYINRELRRKGIFTNSRIVHRVGVSGYTYKDNKQTPEITFSNDEGEVLHTNLASYAQSEWLLPISNTEKGKAYVDDNNQVVEAPFDFGKKNFINIRDLQESLKRLFYPELYPVSQRYNLNDDDRSYLMSSMGRLPRDYPHMASDSTYYDGYVKFFMYGDTKETIPDHITIYNKVGYAYGYLTDCAYIEDTKEDIAYFLTATVLVNENQIFNDGKYEYDEVGIPFLAQLGRLVHQDMIEHANAKK